MIRALFVAAMLFALGAAADARSRQPTPSPTPDVVVTRLTNEESPSPGDSPAPSAVPGVSAPVATPSPPPDPEAERLLRLARVAWMSRKDVPYVRYGALVRYEHNGHVFDNWWDAWFRPSDGALTLHRLVDPEEEKRRLGGIPFSIFGVKIFDTNRESEPIRLDEPRIDPAFSFGILSRFAPVAEGGLATPDPNATRGLPEIGHVETFTRIYDVRFAGFEKVLGTDVVHLTLRPLRDPGINRIRDLWLDPAASYRTVQMRVQGILRGKPYDGVPWTVRYTMVGGRQYLQQIVAGDALHFGFGTTIPRMEFDFVDYHFPADVPKYTFDGSIF